MKKSGFKNFALALGLVLLLVTSGFSLYALSRGLATSAEAERQPQAASTLTAPITQQTLVSLYTAPVTVTPGGKQSVASPAGSAILTRDPLAAGTVLGSGDVLAVLNERPLFVFSGAVPAYRDLALGARGQDVAQLQATLTALGYGISDERGFYGESTARAVFRFYVNSGYYPPGDTDISEEKDAPAKTAFPRSEYLFLKGDTFRLDGACGVLGQAPSGELCTVSDGSSTLSFTADITDLGQQVSAGQRVKVTIDGETITGTVAEAPLAFLEKQDAATGAGGAINGNVVADGSGVGGAAGSGNSADLPNTAAGEAGKAQKKTFTINADLPQNLASHTGGIAQVTLKSSDENALTLPETALRTRTDGSRWVLTQQQDTVDVTVGLCLDGYCALTNPPQSLKAGERVVLNGEN